MKLRIKIKYILKVIYELQKTFSDLNPKLIHLEATSNSVAGSNKVKHGARSVDRPPCLLTQQYSPGKPELLPIRDTHLVDTSHFVMQVHRTWGSLPGVPSTMQIKTTWNFNPGVSVTPEEESLGQHPDRVSLAGPGHCLSKVL